MRHGLMIGKFLPPHEAHLAHILDASRQCDELSVIVMGSQFERLGGFGVDDRVRWLRIALGHGNVRVIAIPADAVEDMNSDTVWAAQVELMRRALRAAERPGPTHVFSAEPYVERLAAELGAQAVRSARSAVHATGIRQQPVARWEEIISPARLDLAVRVIVVGAESTGTTTLSRDLARRYALRFPGLEFVPEYGREYTYLKQAEAALRLPGAGITDIEWEPADFVKIAAEQNRRENAAALRRPLVIGDTNAWATSLWERRYVGSTASLPEAEAAPSPAIYLVTDHVGVEFEDDGWRDGFHIRTTMTDWFLDGLTARGESWVLLRGDSAERLSHATRIVDQSLADRLDWRACPWASPNDTELDEPSMELI